MDFYIGNTEYLGKGLAAETLEKFTQYYMQKVNELADTFFIDPDHNNEKWCPHWGHSHFNGKNTQIIGGFNDRL